MFPMKGWRSLLCFQSTAFFLVCFNMSLFPSIALGIWWFYSIWKLMFFRSGNISWFFFFFHDFLSYIFYFFLTSGIIYFKDIGHTLLVLGSLFFFSFFSFPHFHLWHFAFYSAIVSELSPLNFLLNIFTYISIFNIKKIFVLISRIQNLFSYLWGY